MTRMRIAVTGGSGFIGSRLVQMLLQEGYYVVVVDLNPPQSNQAVEVRIADVEDLQDTKAALRGIDVVYHLAGPVVDAMRRNPYRGYRLQLNGTLNVLEACRQNGVRKVILASSFYVYDGLDPDMVVNEQTPLDIRRMEAFGAAKLMSEAMTMEYSAKYGIQYVILRYGSAYGWGNCTNVVKTFLETALRGEPIEVWGQGRRRNQYTYVDDLAAGSLLSLHSVNEVYNLISPEETTTGELAALLKRRLGADVVYNTIQKEGPSMPYMSSRKAMQQLGWKPITLEEGVERMLQQVQGNKQAG
jgi:UDP-glucose 4-epimerase